MGVIRWLLAYTCIKGNHLRQIDFVTAFLNAKLKREVYIKQIQGFEKDSNMMLKLLKALYSLRKSPVLWQQTLHKYMHEIGFTPSPADPCLYIWKGAVIVIWVNNILLSAYMEDELDEVYEILSKRFNIQNLGSPSKFVGIAIQRDIKKKTLFLF